MVNGRPLLGWRTPSREARDTFFMLALIGWTVLPHLSHLPPWIGALVFGVLAWRGWLALRQAPLPGRGAVLLLLALAAALTFLDEHTLVGKEAGVTLLVVLMALKTLELRARRDALVVFFLGFFLVLTTFLYSQSMLVAASTLVAVWGWLTALTLAHMPAGRPTLRHAAALAGRAALVGTPVMVALFLLFPRIGPLWSSPNDSARTGLSDHLELGNVAELANDDSIAFRLRFDGRAPPADEMYFRGPVLTDTDGHDWRSAPSPEARARGSAARARIRGAAIGFEMTLEPTNTPWLPLLELVPPQAPGADGRPHGGLEILDGAEVQPLPDADGQWRTRRPIAQRVRVHAQAWPDAHLADATPEELERDLALPPGAHPRMRAWAAQWGAAHAAPDGHVDPDAMVASLYRHIATAGFSYTLSPGVYENDAVDEFWLDRRAGFCEHFATAFVVALRAMGVPARVVTGYQGTDPQPSDGYLVVRQSNAHAWAEYWQPARGWVRADPTAAVAPDRIQHGRALRPRAGLVGGALDAMSPGLFEGLRAWREAMDNRWNQWVLGYNHAAQFDLMKRAGFDSPDATDLGRVLIGVIVIAASLGAAAAWWDTHRRSAGQRLTLRLTRALRALRPLGVQVAPHQSPGSIAVLLRGRFGAAAEALAARLDGMERARYGPAQTGSDATLATRQAWRNMADDARALAARAGKVS